MSASTEILVAEPRRRIVAEVDAAIAHRLRVFAAERDITISDLLRGLLENWIHETNLALTSVSALDPPPVKGAPHLLCLKEVASHFQVNRETVRRWVRDGILVAVRGSKGGGYRFDPAAVSRFERKCSTGGRL